MTSTEHSSTTPPEKAGTQCTTTNHYPHWVQGTPQRVKSQPASYTHTSHNKRKSTSRKGTTPPYTNGLLVHDASIQLEQYNTRTTSQSRSHRREIQLLLHNHKPKNSGDQPTPQPVGHTPRRPMPGTFRDSGLSSLM
ncbi:hypothetical protein Taro_019257 [Colocasia esculenta]|uniref:Uncharacterized protein n=1 Tax=Colocasia esculenta TaxID=4460 RepID=A0A843UKN4_COLES|nr:hypothetical protein [Colocasia esculenta]